MYYIIAIKTSTTMGDVIKHERCCLTKHMQVFWKCNIFRYRWLEKNHTISDEYCHRGLK